jgi:hypothetical protein
MAVMTVSEARAALPEILNRVTDGGSRCQVQAERTGRHPSGRSNRYGRQFITDDSKDFGPFSKEMDATFRQICLIPVRPGRSSLPG